MQAQCDCFVQGVGHTLIVCLRGSCKDNQGVATKVRAKLGKLTGVVLKLLCRSWRFTAEKFAKWTRDVESLLLWWNFLGCWPIDIATMAGTSKFYILLNHFANTINVTPWLLRELRILHYLAYKEYFLILFACNWKSLRTFAPIYTLFLRDVTCATQ